MTASKRPITIAGAATLALATTGAATALAAFAGASAPPQTDHVGRSGVAGVKVACPAGTTGGCTGKLTLRTSKPVKQGSRNAVAGLGHASFSTIAPGQSAVVNVKLSQEGVKLVKSGPVKPAAIVNSADGTGAKAKVTTTITLKKRGHAQQPTNLY